MVSARLVAFFALACVPGLVQAHGAISQVVSSGKTFVSPKIGQQGKNGPFWVIDTSDPVTNLDSKDMICGPGASKRTPSESVKVTSGETVQVSWGNGFEGLGSKWPHKFGPIVAYMAKCDSDDCKDITNGGAKWFKISQDAVKDGKWKQEDIFNGKSVGVTIPKGLASGSYVVRHELTNLAIATAELYPGCFRTEVTGNGNEQLSGESAAFPGAYSKGDAGLKMTGTGELFGLKSGYKFSGPSLSTLAAGGSSSSDSGAESDETDTESGSDATEVQDSDNKKDDKKDTESKASGKSVSGAVNNAAAAPEENVAEATESTASTPVESAAEPAESTSAPEETETETEDEATPSPAVADASSGSSSTSSYEQCNQAFLDCNDKWQSTDLTGSYSCQTEFVTCVSSSPKAKRMHRARRNLNRLHSSY